ncbi:MAG: VWA domain-containing protein, partial [Stenotrophomonas sp.]
MSLHLLWPLWLRPQVLWLLLPLLLLGWWYARQQGQQRQWQGVVDAHLLAAQLQPGQAAGLARWRLPLAALLACLALAGPSWGVAAQAGGQARDALVLVVDLSSAMYQDDLAPSRLLRLRSKLQQLLQQRSEGETALVVYAGDAYTVVPLTADSANIALYVGALAPTVMPADGQRLDLAIARATGLLQASAASNGRILVMAGQADAAAASAAAQAQAQGWPLAVLAVRGDGVDAGLQALAAAGGGRAQAIALDDSDLQALAVTAVRGGGDAAAQAAVKGQREGQLQPRDDGFWLLPVVLLLLLPSLRRGLPVVLLALLLPLAMPAPAQAAGSNWWQRADQQAWQRNARAVQAYRAGDHASAEVVFARDHSALGRYNLGNALARQGKLEQALAAYDQALAQQPAFDDARANRAAVAAAMKRQQGQQGQQGQ